jgi:hypothetical protein
MRKTLIPALGLLVLVSAVCLRGQSGSSSPDAGQAPAKASGKTAALTTIEGCLQSSQGQYTLTDNEGTVHQLSGAANKLVHHVGHQVELTGKPGIRTSDTTQPGTSSSAIEERVFEVKSIKPIADTCKGK